MEHQTHERDDRSDSFRMISGVVCSIAAAQGVNVDPLTRRRWSDTLALLREFDTLADDTNISNEAAINELKSFDRFSKNYPHLTPPTLPTETHDRMVRRVETILEHSTVIATTLDIDEFMHHRTEEVDKTTELLADCATGDTTTQIGFYTRFMPVMRGIGRTANYVDTLTDHHQDFKESKVALEGSPVFYARVGQKAISGLIQATPHILHPDIMKQFYDMSVMRLENRIAYGKTPYSSLKHIS